MYTIKNTTGGCGAKGASGAGIAPPGNPGDVLYLVSSGVAGAAANVLYTGDGNLYAANSVTTTNAFATRYYGDGGLLSNITTSAISIPSNLIIQPFANLVSSNALVTTNVFATTYYGDGGLLSNVFVQPLANLVVSNSVTTTNIFATSANIATMNVGYLTVNSAVVYGTSTLNVYGTSNLTNVTVTDTFNVNGSMTANAANATFFFDTFTIPYINTQVLNVASNIILSGNLSAPLANITTLNVNYLTVNSAVVYGTSTLNVYGVSNLSTATMVGTSGKTTLNVTGNVYASNAVTTTNVFATTTNTQVLSVTSNMTFTGPLATLSNLTVPGNANIEYLSVSNLSVTGNLIVTATNVQTTNALKINNSGTATALKVYQNEPSIHTHNVAEFWDATTLAMVIDPEGNVAIHTVSSPGYSLTVTDPANFETLYIRGKTGTTTLNVTGNITASNAVTTTNVFATRYYGDGGLLSNVFVQPFANLVVSNAVTTTNIFALTANLSVANIANIYTTNIVGFIGSQWTTGTGNVYYLNGVGIGTTNVSSNLTVQGNLYASNAVTATNVFANTLTLTGTGGQTTLYIKNNVFVSDTITTMIDNTSLALYIGGTTITSVPTRSINTYSTSYPNFLATGGSAFYFNDTPVTALAFPSIGTFGYSSSMSADGNTVIVCGSLATGLSPYVYRFTGGSWNTGTALTGQAISLFGIACSMSADGNTVIVTGQGTGLSPYVYRFTGGSWNSGTALTAQAVTSFGASCGISADGNTVIVTGQGTGLSPYVYRFSGGSWDSGTALTAKAVSGFGKSCKISADGNTVIVTGYNTGTTPYVYRFIGGSWDSGTALTAQAISLFGISCSMSADGNTVIVTGSGTGLSPYVYRFSGGSWNTGTALTAQAVTSFGKSCAMSADGNTAIITGQGALSPYIYVIDTRFRVNNTLNIYNGSVGISTTTPTATIHITGNLYASNALTATALYGNVVASNVVVTPATGVTGINVTGNIYASNAVTATNVFSTNVYASGYVGIGTTNPQYLLHVTGAAASTVSNIVVEAGTNAIGQRSEIRFGIPAFSGTGKRAGITSNTYVSDGSDLQFWTNATSGTASAPRMTILQSGFVGIGTTGPGYTLDVSGDINALNSLRIGGLIQPRLMSSGTFTGVTSFDTVTFDLVNYNVVEIRMTVYFSTQNSRIMSSQLLDTGSTVYSANESGWQMFSSGTTASVAGSGAYILNNTEIVSVGVGGFIVVIRLIGAMGISGTIRNHWEWTTTGCYAGTGASTTYGRAAIYNSSGATINRMRFNLSGGTMTGKYSIINYST